jgi:hypothetical protein
MSIPFNIGVLQLSMEPVGETVAMAKACENAGLSLVAQAFV